MYYYVVQITQFRQNFSWNLLIPRPRLAYLLTKNQTHHLSMLTILPEYLGYTFFSPVKCHTSLVHGPRIPQANP